MRKSTFRFGSFVIATLVSLGAAGSAHASGFALIEVNATGQGNAYAGAAAATNNASTIFFNPAGMMNLDGQQLVFAAHQIDPSADFTNDGSSRAPTLALFGAGGPLSGGDDETEESAFVPNLYWVKPLNEDTSFGFGVFTPFGLTTEYDDDWVGRYHATLSDMRTVNFNPSLARRISDKLSIGGGVNLMLADVTLGSMVDFGSICYALDFQVNNTVANCAGAGANPEAVDGEADLTGDNFDSLGLGFNVGLHYMVSSQTSIGVAYRSSIDIEVEGDADFTVPNNPAVQLFVGGAGLFEDTGLEAEVTLPASFSFSVAHQVGKITWLADATWTDWSQFDELRIEYDNSNQPDSVTTEDWNDTWRYSVGFDYQATDKLILRAGLALDESPVPSAERRTPRLPGDDREWISVGFSYLATKMVSIDFGYTHLTMDDAKIDNTFESALSTINHQLTGEYEAEVDIVSLQLNWQMN